MPAHARDLAQIHATLEVRPGLFRRYHGELTTGEGAFGICSFWAAEYLALGGGTVEEPKTTSRCCSATPTTSASTGRRSSPTRGALGNFPQAYTHVGLINAASRCATAGARKVGGPARARRIGGGPPMNWPGILLAGFAGTLVLTSLESARSSSISPA